MAWFYVFIGGGLGSVLRFLISRLVLNFRLNSIFPWATLISNVLACAVLAYLSYKFFAERSVNEFWKMFWLVGFCGGFSTFSTFSMENWALYKNGNYTFLAINILLSLILCFVIFALVDKKINV